MSHFVLDWDTCWVHVDLNSITSVLHNALWLKLLRCELLLLQKAFFWYEGCLRFCELLDLSLARSTATLIGYAAAPTDDLVRSTALYDTRAHAATHFCGGPCIELLHGFAGLFKGCAYFWQLLLFMLLGLCDWFCVLWAGYCVIGRHSRVATDDLRLAYRLLCIEFMV